MTTDPALRSYVEERRALDQRMGLDPRVKAFSALVPEKRSMPRWWFAVPAAAVIAAIAFLPRGAEIGVKGGITVRAQLLREGKTESVSSGAVLRKGDRIQLAIEDPEGGHPAVIWADDRGHARAIHRPEELGRMEPPLLTLPDSFEIDGEPGRERITVILCTGVPDIDRWPAQIAENYHEDWIPPGGCRAGLFEWRVE